MIYFEKLIDRIKSFNIVDNMGACFEMGRKIDMLVIEAVKKFLTENECIEPDEDIDPSESLLEEGIIDSVVIVEMISFLEEKFGIEIDEDDLMPENFESFAAINNYVRTKTGCK
jgi:acyl carrier protein